MIEERTINKDIIGRGFAFPLRIGARGGLMLTNEQSELTQAIMIVLMTPQGQRVMRPTFGCRIHELLFAPNSSETLALAQRYVEEALAMWEPRIDVMRVHAYSDPEEDSALLIEVVYRPKNKKDERALVYPFYLIPEE